MTPTTLRRAGAELYFDVEFDKFLCDFYRRDICDEKIVEPKLGGAEDKRKPGVLRLYSKMGALTAIEKKGLKLLSG